jgi:hypothetical protein
VHTVFCKFIVNSNIVASFHHKMAMKCLSERDKCKICDVGLHSRVLGDAKARYS